MSERTAEHLGRAVDHLLATLIAIVIYLVLINAVRLDQDIALIVAIGYLTIPTRTKGE